MATNYPIYRGPPPPSDPGYTMADMLRREETKSALVRQQEEMAAKCRGVASARQMAGPPAPDQLAALRATVEDVGAAVNRLADLVSRQQESLAQLAAMVGERLPAPPAPKGPLSMRAYRGMQCGYDDDMR